MNSFKNSSLIISLKIKRVKEIDNDSVKRNLLHAKVTGEIDKTHPINKIDQLFEYCHIAVTEQYLHAPRKKLEQAMLADPLAVGVS